MKKEKEELIKKIRRREAKIAVIGLGHVGLPTAAIFANAGFRVTGADVSQKIVAVISKGKSPYVEPNLDNLLRKAKKTGRLEVTTNSTEAVKETNVVVVCVQTPLTEDKKPNLNYLRKACEVVINGLSRGKLVLIESTVPPRTINDIIVPLFEKGGDLKCGTDFWLAYCPERIAPGKAIRDFVESPRIIGGYNRESAEVTVELLKTIVKGEILTTDCTSAEIAKLSENAFRDVNIAFANELALICEQIGADVTEVIRLANTHPRVNVHKPGCGVGGPCLPKDPHLLLHSTKKEGLSVIEPSRELNDYMAGHTVELVIKALKKAGKSIQGSRIAVFGAAYKGGIADTRNSSAEKITHELIKQGAEVVVYDPYSNESFGAKKAKNIDTAVKGADCIVIATNHEVFKELKLERIKALMGKKPAIIDGRRIVHPEQAKKQDFIYLGVGYSK